MNKFKEMPYFGDVDISFINIPFVACKDKFVYPDQVEEYVIQMMDNFIGYSIQLKDGKPSGFILSKLPEYNNLFVSDATRIAITLEGIVKDFFPKEVMCVFDDEILDDNIKQNMIYELNRYNAWIEFKGGRSIKEEIYFRFGLTEKLHNEDD